MRLGGKERTFWFGLGFLGSYLANSNIKLSEIDQAIESNPFRAIPEMMFQSLKYGYDRVGASVDFSLYDVAEWIDENGGVSGDLVQTFLKAFGESMKTSPSANPQTRKSTRADKKKV